MAIDLEFITTASGDDANYKISGIPDKIWDSFKKQAKDYMPEKGDLAWASLLTEIIQKNVASSVYTFIMTDIPQEARESFNRVAQQAELSLDHIIGIMFRRAMTNDLHIVNMIALTTETPPPEMLDEDGNLTEDGYDWLVEQKEKTGDIEKSKTLVITGLGNSAWEKWAEVAKTAHMAPEELIGHMFEAAAGGSLNLTKNEVKDPKEFKFNQ